MAEKGIDVTDTMGRMESGRVGSREGRQVVGTEG